MNENYLVYFSRTSFLGAVSMPSGYYELLRWVICAAAVFAAYTNCSIDKSTWAISFGVVALIFNPFVPLYLYDKFLWMVIDISAGLMFVINSKKLKINL